MKKIKLLEVRQPDNPQEPIYFELTEAALGAVRDYFQYKSIGFKCKAKCECGKIKIKKYWFAMYEMGYLGDLFEGDVDGEVWQFKIIEMPVKEYESLPEFEGGIK